MKNFYTLKTLKIFILWLFLAATAIHAQENLVKKLLSENPKEILEAAAQLKKLDVNAKKLLVPVLAKFLKDSNPSIRLGAVRSLGWIGSIAKDVVCEKKIEKMMNLLGPNAGQAQEIVITKTGIDALLDSLDADDIPEVRQETLKSLDKMVMELKNGDVYAKTMAGELEVYVQNTQANIYTRSVSDEYLGCKPHKLFISLSLSHKNKSEMIKKAVAYVVDEAKQKYSPDSISTNVTPFGAEISIHGKTFHHSSADWRKGGKLELYDDNVYEDIRATESWAIIGMNKYDKVPKFKQIIYQTEDEKGTPTYHYDSLPLNKISLKTAQDILPTLIFARQHAMDCWYKVRDTIIAINSAIIEQSIPAEPLSDIPSQNLDALAKLDLSSKDSIIPLIHALQSTDSSIRKLAAEVLGKSGPFAQDALSALRKAIGDKDEDVRSATIIAITQITGKQYNSGKANL